MKYTVLVSGMLLVLASTVFAGARVQDGVCTVFLADEGGYTFLVEMHKGWQRDGLVMQFYPDGTIEKTGWYHNGILHGAYESFWPNGQRKFFLRYRNGLLDGPARRYGRDGNLRLKFNYERGSIKSPVYYYEHGGIVRIVEPRAGRLLPVK